MALCSWIKLSARCTLLVFYLLFPDFVECKHLGDILQTSTLYNPLYFLLPFFINPPTLWVNKQHHLVIQFSHASEEPESLWSGTCEIWVRDRPRACSNFLISIISSFYDVREKEIGFLITIRNSTRYYHLYFQKLYWPSFCPCWDQNSYCNDSSQVSEKTKTTESEVLLITRRMKSHFYRVSLISS